MCSDAEGTHMEQRSELEMNPKKAIKATSKQRQRQRQQQHRNRIENRSAERTATSNRQKDSGQRRRSPQRTKFDTPPVQKLSLPRVADPHRSAISLSIEYLKKLTPFRRDCSGPGWRVVIG